MTYRQDSTPRGCCEICTGEIQNGEWIMDLFRETSGRSVVWVHEKCARSALETFIIKKEERTRREGQKQ